MGHQDVISKLIKMHCDVRIILCARSVAVTADHIYVTARDVFIEQGMYILSRTVLDREPDVRCGSVKILAESYLVAVIKGIGIAFGKKLFGIGSI